MNYHWIRLPSPISVLAVLIYFLCIQIEFVNASGLGHGIWGRYMDREYMRYYTLPRAGKLAGSTGKILEIGCEGYNVDDYKMCGVPADNYYFVDVYSRRGWGTSYGHVLEMPFSNLTEYQGQRFHNFFDVIIDYGALGYGGTIWKEVYDDDQIVKHIEAFSTLLKPGGFLLMKWDFGSYAVGKGQKDFWTKWHTLLRKNLINVHEYLQIPSYAPDNYRNSMLDFLGKDAPPHRIVHPHYVGNFSSREFETLLYLEYMKPINYSCPHGQGQW